jgi:hypothetical protein
MMAEQPAVGFLDGEKSLILKSSQRDHKKRLA